MNTKLDLRGLSEAERNAEINAAVAEASGRYKWRNDFNTHKSWLLPIETSAGIPLASELFKCRDTGSCPRYATSADAVLPLMEKECALYRLELAEHYPAEPQHGIPQQWNVTIIKTEPHGFSHNIYANAPTFALAACIALLRANGVEVMT
jgi:hypothetical protein